MDLFLELDAAITEREIKEGVKIGFWRIPRRINAVADELARDAALRAVTLDIPGSSQS